MQTTTIFSKMFLLPTDRGVKTVALQNLVRIEAVSNYSKLHFSDGRTLVVARVLCKFENELSACFLRIHHKHLVNLRWLSAQIGKNEAVLLGNGEALTISRRKKKEVQAALAKWFCENQEEVKSVFVQ